MTQQHGDPEIRLEMASKPRLLAAARAMVGNVAQRLGFTEVQCGQISLAVDEALCNIIKHGYDRRSDGKIWISIWALTNGRGSMKIVLEDRAKQVEPESIRSRDLEDIRPGGLGVFIIREVMDEVTYERRRSGGMRLTLVKHLAVAEGDGAGTHPSAVAAAESETGDE